MEDTITITYYLCDEFLKAIGHHDDQQVRLSTAEVMSVALVAATFFGGNVEASRSFLDEYGYIEKTISNYVVDSLPVAVCDNIRIRRSKLYPLQEHGEAFRGYIASKRRY